jgi:gallate dioxygenase
MRGALSATVKRVHRDLTLPSMTTIATVIYENEAETEPAAIDAHRRRVAHQLAGIERLEGTHPFTVERSRRAYRLNDFLHRLVEPAHRKRFVAAPEGLYDEFELSGEERRLLDARDFIGLIHYGVIFFCLEKMAAVLGMSNPDVYAQMRGESIEDFLKSRNVGIHYSVAGIEEATVNSGAGAAHRARPSADKHERRAEREARAAWVTKIWLHFGETMA